MRWAWLIYGFLGGFGSGWICREFVVWYLGRKIAKMTQRQIAESFYRSILQ